MQTKLTLRLDRQLIEQAKQHARHQGKSLSQIVANYFASLHERPKQGDIPPVTRSLHGLLSTSQLDEKSYKKHLEDKYL